MKNLHECVYVWLLSADDVVLFYLLCSSTFVGKIGEQNDIFFAFSYKEFHSRDVA